MVQPPAAAPPGIDPMILQQQQAAAQEAALQQVPTQNQPPEPFSFSSQSTNLYSLQASDPKLGFQEREKRAAETLIYKEQVKRQMEGLDPVKRMEADPNYINAVSIFEKSRSSYPTAKSPEYSNSKWNSILYSYSHHPRPILILNYLLLK